MLQTITTRSLTPNDYVQFRSLRQQHLELDGQSVTTSAKDWREASKEQVLALLSLEGRREHNFMMGAFQNDKLVGHIGFQRNIKKMQTAHKGLFWGLYVNPDYRNQGIGAQLVQASLDVLSTYEWCEIIRIQITTTDAYAMQLAAHFGFEFLGLERKGLKMGNTYFDYNSYVKYL